jgi:hypothetical protein
VRVTIGKHTISLGLIGAILSILCLGAFAAYMLTINIPVTVQEPIEILSHPEALDLYPGETIDFNITIQNHASVDYALLLDFYLDNTIYQHSYVTTSNETYVVHPGVQDLSSWLKVSANAPPLSSALTINFRREAIEDYEQIKITNMAFPTGQVTLTIANTGTSPVTMSEVHINNGANIISTCTNATWAASPVIPAGVTYSETFTFAWTNGIQYEAELRSTKGNQFTYTATAPS